MKDTIYYKQAELVLRILPFVNSEKDFAIKGGTAINFFVRDLPRISVDIDLSYVPINSRDTALEDISRSIENISTKIKRIFPDCILSFKKIRQPEAIRTLIVNLNGVTIKIEPNLVIRGAIYEPEVMQLSQKAQNLFEMKEEFKIGGARLAPQKGRVEICPNGVHGARRCDTSTNLQD